MVNAAPVPNALLNPWLLPEFADCHSITSCPVAPNTRPSFIISPTTIKLLRTPHPTAVGALGPAVALAAPVTWAPLRGCRAASVAATPAAAELLVIAGAAGVGAAGHPVGTAATDATNAVAVVIASVGNFAVWSTTLVACHCATRLRIRPVNAAKQRSGAKKSAMDIRSRTRNKARAAIGVRADATEHDAQNFSRKTRGHEAVRQGCSAEKTHIRAMRSSQRRV